MRTFIVGDIHGCYDELLELLDQANIQENDLVISVGDIVDRGPKSLEEYRYFKARENTLVLMGNHERKHLKGVLSYAQEIVKIQFGNEYVSFVNWIGSLPYYYETEEAIIVHAAFEHDQMIGTQREDVLCGSTSGDRYLQTRYPKDSYWSDFYSGEKTIIYGHHVVGESPKYLNNTIGIDTGSCHGGKLTMIELPNFVVHQVQVKTDYWKEQQNSWQLKVLAEKPWNTMSFDSIQKLLNKLNYIENKEVVSYLEEVSNWIKELDNLLFLLFEEMKKLVEELTTKHRGV